ncbi:MAG: heparinase II/III family protein [Armatimonadota bacterium]
MVEWKLSAAGKAKPSARVSEGSINIGQLSRVINMSPRPFVLINERELSVLRRGLTKDGWKRILYLQPADLRHGIYVGAGLLSTANQWLEKEVQIPEPETEMGKSVCDSGTGEVSNDPTRHTQHARLAGAALSLAIVYSIEKDKTYSDKAAQILLMYSEYYRRLGNCRENVRDSSAEAAWAIAMTQAYDLIYYSRSLNENERAAIETQLFRPLANRFRDLEDAGVPGAWHLSAVGVIGLCTKDAQLVAASIDSYRKWISTQIGDGGLLPEHLNAHFSATSALLYFAEACYHGGIDIFSMGSQTRSLKAMFLAPLNLMYPSFRFPAIGNEQFDSFLPLDLYEVAYRRWGDPELSWVLKKGYKFGQDPANNYHLQHPERFSRSGFYAFLFGRDLPGRSAAPLFKSEDYPSLGICTLRSGDDLMATVDYYAHNNHHLSRLGFTLSAGDDVVIADYGTSPLCSSAISEWSQSTAAHNTVMVDEKSQSLAGKSGLTAQCYGTFIQGVECIASNCYPGVSHKRKIIILDRICIIQDNLTGDDEHNYDWLMRCQGIARLHGCAESIEVPKSNTPMIEWKKAYKTSGECRVDWQLSNGVLAAGIWHFGSKGEIALGNCATDTAQNSVPILRCRQQGKEASFLAVLAPMSEADEIFMKRDRNLITLTKKESVEYLYIRGCDDVEKNATQNGLELETDASFAAVRTCDGEIRSMVISEGSWLKWNGKSILECSSQVGCLELVFEERGPQMKYHGEASGMVKIRTNARAMRVNGVRAQAYNTDGYATLRIAGHMIAGEMHPHKN